MKKEIITVQVDYEIEYEPGHREEAIKDALKLSYGVSGGWTRVSRLHDTVKMVEATEEA